MRVHLQRSGAVDEPEICLTTLARLAFHSASGRQSDLRCVNRPVPTFALSNGNIKKNWPASDTRRKKEMLKPTKHFSFFFFVSPHSTRNRTNIHTVATNLFTQSKNHRNNDHSAAQSTSDTSLTRTTGSHDCLASPAVASAIRLKHIVVTNTGPRRHDRIAHVHKRRADTTKPGGMKTVAKGLKASGTRTGGVALTDGSPGRTDSWFASALLSGRGLVQMSKPNFHHYYHYYFLNYYR